MDVILSRESSWITLITITTVAWSESQEEKRYRKIQEGPELAYWKMMNLQSEKIINQSHIKEFLHTNKKLNEFLDSY